MNKLIIACVGVAFTQTVSATELVHHFVSPSMGGNPLNGTFLLGEASAQNQFKDPAAQTGQRSPIDTFKASLQSAILNQVSRSTTQNLFDTSGNIKLGSDLNFDLNGDGQSDFSVLVSQAPTNGNININISDGITSTVLTVPYLTPVTKP